MAIDVMVLKADPDAASPERIAAARSMASDPDAPRRALVKLGWERATSPANYVGAIATAPPAGLQGEALQAWHDTINSAPQPDLHRGNEGKAEAPGSLGAHDLLELDDGERLAGFDALTDADRERCIGAFRLVANDWLDVAASAFGGDDDLAQADGWHEVAQFHTQDGGRLLICAVDDQDLYLGVPAWFESVLFVLGQVADVAGFREPTSFDVR